MTNDARHELAKALESPGIGGLPWAYHPPICSRPGSRTVFPLSGGQTGEIAPLRGGGCNSATLYALDDRVGQPREAVERLADVAKAVDLDNVECCVGTKGFG